MEKTFGQISRPAALKAGILALTAILLLSCGVKKPPQPPLKAGPPAVMDLRVLPREGNLLMWTSPQPVANTRQTAPERCVVIRRDWSDDENRWLEPVAVATVPASKPDAKIQWLDRDVQQGRRYLYVVTAVDSHGRAGDSSAEVVVQWTPPPEAPRNLAVEPGDRSATLTWAPPPGHMDVQGYYVYRAREDGIFRRLNEDAAPRLTFFDAGLRNGVRYRYKVRATSMAGTNLVEGPPTGEVETVPADAVAPQVPVGVDAFPVEGGVEVRWWPNGEDDLAGYHVYRKYGRKTDRITPTPVNEARYLDSTAREAKVYRYYVTAVDNAGNESPLSEGARVYVRW